MFIVIPYITKNPTIYGIYAICISISIFLSYADLGFISVGQKYAAEYFIKKDRKNEMQITGFAIFILSIFIILFSIAFFVLSSNPHILIKNINLETNESSVASSLFLILALFAPTTILQRLMQMIYGIRLEEYIIQRFNIVASILKILSVLWFFRSSHYNIVGYFLFSQILNFLTSFIALFLAHKRYNYSIKELLGYIRFDNQIFIKTKKLAFNSLYLIITWILYYELDPTIIGKFLGPTHVAIYAIGLTILSFFRSIFGILYSPFNARFNYFIGLDDLDGLKKAYIELLIILTPIVVLPIITIAIMAKSLIITWVGPEYNDSIIIAQLLVLCNFFAFITYPTSILLMAQERIKEMYVINTLIPLVFWGGIIITFNIGGLNSFAIFKLVAFGISAIGYYFISLKFLNISILNSLKLIFSPIILPIVFTISISFITYNYLPQTKSMINFSIVAFSAVTIFLFSLIILFITSRNFRNKMIHIIKFKVH